MKHLCWLQLILLFLSIYSCQSKPSNTESIISYIAQLDSNVNVQKVIISDKYIATVDSTEISNFISTNNSNDEKSLTKKLQLAVGSNVYFSILNSGNITEHQIENIIETAKRYENLNLTPETYCIFSIISIADGFGDINNASMAFLFNKNDSIEKAKLVEPCNLFLGLFDKKEVDNLIK